MEKKLITGHPMNIFAFRSMKAFWNQQTSGCMGPGGTKGGNYFLEARELLMFLDNQKKYTALELGCGSGELYGELKNLYRSYVGIDFSASNLRVFKENHPTANIICADVLEFALNKKFELIHSNHLVQCLSLQQIEKLEQKLFDLCLPGGLIIHRGFLDNLLKTLYFQGYLYPGINRRLPSRRFHPLAYRLLEIFNTLTRTFNGLGFWHTREAILDLHQKLGMHVEIFNSPLHPNRFNIVVRM